MGDYVVATEVLMTHSSATYARVANDVANRSNKFNNSKRKNRSPLIAAAAAIIIPILHSSTKGDAGPTPTHLTELLRISHNCCLPLCESCDFVVPPVDKTRRERAECGVARRNPSDCAHRARPVHPTDPAIW
jgi:hypothetical protein